MKYTQKIIYWLDHQAFSKNHWEEVSQEILAKEKTIQEAIPILAKVLEDFHHKYKKAVIKPDNVLNDFVDMCFDEVDWETVAKSRYLKEGY